MAQPACRHLERVLRYGEIGAHWEALRHEWQLRFAGEPGDEFTVIVRLCSQAMVGVGDHQGHARPGTQMAQQRQQGHGIQAAGHRHDQRPRFRPEPVPVKAAADVFDERIHPGQCYGQGLRQATRILGVWRRGRVNPGSWSWPGASHATGFAGLRQPEESRTTTPHTLTT